MKGKQGEGIGRDRIEEKRGKVGGGERGERKEGRGEKRSKM